MVWLNLKRRLILKIQKKSNFFWGIKQELYICTPENDWEFSSAGSEHLPYKQRVTGSNPVTPTKSPIQSGFFISNTILPNLRNAWAEKVNGIFRG